MVDADRRLRRHLHAPARRHDRQRRPARHPERPRLVVLAAAVGDRRLRALARGASCSRPGRWPTSTGAGCSSRSACSSSRRARCSAGSRRPRRSSTSPAACRGSAARSCSPPRSRCSRNEFHGRERGTAFGIWGATTGGAVAIGPLAGGIVTETLGWRWIFLLNVPIGIAALVVTLLRVGESRDPEHGGVDVGGCAHLQRRPLPARVRRWCAGNSGGWGSIEIVATLAGSAILLRRVRRDRAPELASDARPQPLPRAGLCGRADRGVRALGVGVRDLPLPDAVHAEHPRLLAARDRDPLPPHLAAGIRRGADLGEDLELHARAAR